MAIFVTGDTHGAKDIDGYKNRFSNSSFPEQKELTKDDFVIICGDFGGIWYTNRKKFVESQQYEITALNELNKRKFTTLFVPGNHENYDRLTGIKDEKLLNSWLFANMPPEEKDKFRQGYPRIAWHGGFVRQIRPSILMLEPGVFDIDGKKIFVYGGAASHDIEDGILNPANFSCEKAFEIAWKQDLLQNKQIRVKGVSWWEQEQPDENTENIAIEALKQHNWSVDFVVTHDCAVSDRATMGYSGEIYPICQFLEHVKQNLTYKHWFFGHYHRDETLPGYKEHCLYHQIIQIA